MIKIKCANYGDELTEITDTTYANYTNDRVVKGQHTGDIYDCPVCEQSTINDLLNGEVRIWSYT